MINREKVIRHIIAEISIAKTCKKDFASVDIDMLSDALTLLKEQEPVKPSVGSSNEPDGHGGWWYQCGKCKIPIDHGDRYCRWCGREVKWDERNDIQNQ